MPEIIEKYKIYICRSNNTFKIRKDFNKDKLYNPIIPSLISKFSYISPKAIVLESLIVIDGAIINLNAVIKNFCIVNSYAVIQHSSIINE